MGDLSELMGGNYRGAPEPRDVAQQVDWAMKTIGLYCEPFVAGVGFHPKANQSAYRLDDLRYFDRLFIRPEQLIYAGTRLLGADGTPGIFNHNQAVLRNQKYRTESNGDMVVYSGNNLIEVFPVPTTEKVAEGGHTIDGVCIPGWILSNGGYWPGGSPIGENHVISGGSSGTSGSATNPAGTVGTMGATWTNPNNVKVDDTSVAAFESNLISTPEMLDALDPSRTTSSAPGLILSNFGFTAPSGASSISVNIESVQAGSITTDLRLTCVIVDDVTATTLNALGTFTVDVSEGAGTAEVGPLTSLLGVSRAQLNAVNFGVVIFIEWIFPPAEPIPFDLNAEIEFVSLKASWSVPGSSTPTSEGAGGEGGSSLEETDWDAVPDLPVYMHEALAALAAYKAANPVAMLDMNMRSIERILPDVVEAMGRYKRECARPVADLDRPYHRFNRRV
jgi:hypothetical protein